MHAKGSTPEPAKENKCSHEKGSTVHREPTTSPEFLRVVVVDWISSSDKFAFSTVSKMYSSLISKLKTKLI